MKVKGKRSIKTRIFSIIIIFIICIFSIVAIFFNRLVDKYIDDTCNSILNNIKTSAQEGKGKKGQGQQLFSDEESLDNFFNHINEKGKGSGKYQNDVKIMIVDKDYNFIGSRERYLVKEDSDECMKFVQYLKDKKISLDSTENLKVEINESYYYISFLPIDDNNYYVFTIDITNTLYFVRKINAMLCMTVLLAIVIAIFVAHIIAKRIADPIEKLEKFAEQIGKGNFNKFSYNFKDREIDELCNVMNKSAEYLDKYDKDQKIFFQNVSHELRTPLMSIKGYAEAIKYDMVDKNEASDIILDEGSRLEELIEELLYISRADNITKDYKMSERDLREILSDCTIKEKSLALKKNIEFAFDFDEDAVNMMCDEKSLYRAFINIIDNAVRYAKSRIDISCRKKNDLIEIVIKNDGSHIEEKDMNHIFDRFYKGKQGKNGIGLSIVKSVIENHKGSVYAQNVDDGVEFSIKFNMEIFK